MPTPKDFSLLSRRTPEGKEFFKSGLCINSWCHNIAHNAYRCAECEERRRAEDAQAKLNNAQFRLRRAERKAERVALGIDGFRRRGTPELNFRNAVHALTRAAVANGFLVDPKTCKCADCEKQAECYDHRDYSNPMLVEPVCRPCNNRRGRGFMPPLVAKFQDLKAA